MENTTVNVALMAPERSVDELPVPTVCESIYQKPGPGKKMIIIT